MNTPDEHNDQSPASDESRPILLGMPPAWQAVYDRIREAHALAVLEAMDRPEGHEAHAVLKASSAAVRAFRLVYEQTRTAGLAAQINSISSEGFQG